MTKRRAGMTKGGGESQRGPRMTKGNDRETKRDKPRWQNKR